MGSKGHRLRHAFLVVEIIISLIGIAFGGYKLWDYLTPNPVLVVRSEDHRVPGLSLEIREFHNPTNYPIYNLLAEWDTDNSSVLLRVADGAPKNAPDSKLRLRKLALQEPLPVKTEFKAYLFSTQPFTVQLREIKAQISIATDGGNRFREIYWVKPERYAQMERKQDIWFAGLGVLAIALAFAIHKFLRSLVKEAVA